MTLAQSAAQLSIASPCGKARRNLPALWLLSDEARLPDPRPALLRLAPGSGFIFRHYESGGREALARELLRLCRGRRIMFLLGGDWRMAHRIRANGVHLPEHRAYQARAIHNAMPGAIVTAAAHSLRAARYAFRAGADAVLLSPVFATRSHPGSPVMGAVRFAGTVRRAQLPVIALGGVNAYNARRLNGSGAAGLAASAGLARNNARTD